MRYPLQQLLGTIEAVIKDDVLPHVHHAVAGAQLEAVMEILPRLNATVEYRTDAVMVEIARLASVASMLEAIGVHVDRAATAVAPDATLDELEAVERRLTDRLLECFHQSFEPIHRAGIEQQILAELGGVPAADPPHEARQAQSETHPKGTE
jgi:hypothetical protein